MAYSEARKKYAREWYHRNKARLLSDPKRKESKRLRDRVDYQKHKEKRLAYQKRYTAENREKIREKKSIYYQRYKIEKADKLKQRRNSLEYKEYMRQWRVRNKSRILEQQRKRHHKWIVFQIGNLTDYYIISQILMSRANIFTLQELKLRQDLIEKKREQIKSYREKYNKPIDILKEIELIGKAYKPYEFTKYPDIMEERAYKKKAA